MKLILATNNAHKAKEIQAILTPYYAELATMREAGLDIEVDEDGATFEENALKKANEVLALAQDFDAALADDSGLCVDALGGAPGVYSARFAGEGHDDAANNAKLMDVMTNVPERERGCRFVSVIALARRGAPPIIVRGECEGRVLFGPRGTGGFGYDPYFYYAPLGCSFAELTEADKNKVSHRARALQALQAALVRD
ncbi:MAG: RdgB/HAM1 family non-canonical purine NTP pyrophosphatase [Clostridiales bacterium]|nr:RdgB/HAM1 family non-canonical purine NTP pyrophosphatase [Clostridiales bacterium]